MNSLPHAFLAISKSDSICINDCQSKNFAWKYKNFCLSFNRNLLNLLFLITLTVVQFDFIWHRKKKHWKRRCTFPCQKNWIVRLRMKWRHYSGGCIWKGEYLKQWSKHPVLRISIEWQKNIAPFYVASAMLLDMSASGHEHLCRS